MQLVTIDFETFYSQDYSLSKMTTQEYVQDPQFQIIGAAISLGASTAPQWWEGWTGVDFALRHIMSQPDKQILAVGHNMIFDGMILTHHFPSFKATKYACTMSMARALGIDQKVGGSLNAIAKFLQAAGVDVPDKGDEVVRAKGKRLEDFERDELQAYAQYCKKDTLICRTAFRYFLEHLPKQEMAWQDTVIKMHVEPNLMLNRQLLDSELDRVVNAKQALLDDVMEKLHVESQDQLKAKLSSNQQFADLLLSLGVTPAMKPSPSNPEKQTYAFAKTDKAMTELQEHPDIRVQALANARLGTKSTIEQTRIERFISVSKYPKFAVPCTVSGAHTHRPGGADKLNLLNLPSGRKAGQTNGLRRAIVAQPGHVVLAGDSSQIEARVLAYAANQLDLLELFRNKQDPYVAMAAKIYNVPAQEILEGYKRGEQKYVIMRQMGKKVILACGYQMGPDRFMESCREEGITVDRDEAKFYVGQYREAMDAINDFWKETDIVFRNMIDGEQGYFGGPDGKLFYYDGSRQLFHEKVPGIMLPDGMWLNYRDLRWGTKEFDGKVSDSMVFTRRKNGRMQDEFIYGGKGVENLIQALAFAIMKRQANLLSQLFPVCFNVYDEFVQHVPEAQAESAKQAMQVCMTRAPKWVSGLPLACDVTYAKSYGEC